MKNGTVISLLLVLFLAGCGGKSSDNDNGTPAGDGSSTSPKITTVKAGEATITRTLQPGV